MRPCSCTKCGVCQSPLPLVLSCMLNHTFPFAPVGCGVVCVRVQTLRFPTVGPTTCWWRTRPWRALRLPTAATATRRRRSAATTAAWTAADAVVGRTAVSVGPQRRLCATNVRGGASGILHFFSVVLGVELLPRLECLLLESAAEGLVTLLIAWKRRCRRRR